MDGVAEDNHQTEKTGAGGDKAGLFDGGELTWIEDVENRQAEDSKKYTSE